MAEAERNLMSGNSLAGHDGGPIQNATQSRFFYVDGNTW
jgi:hypothetical protein